tara:strand:- start:10 stop:285 length:276 start_codon:yes stop_codon:yes gene_type:complete
MAKEIKATEKSNVVKMTYTEMLEAHQGVFDSLVKQDGLYKPAEAKEINNAMGKQIAGRVFLLEAYKACGMKPTNDALMLTPGKPKASRGKK